MKRKQDQTNNKAKQHSTPKCTQSNVLESKHVIMLEVKVYPLQVMYTCMYVSEEVGSADKVM